MSPASENPVTDKALEQEPQAVTPADLEALADQLGRVPRGVVSIAARCV